MKKIILIMFVGVFMFFPFSISAEELNLAQNAKSAILIDAGTGNVFFEKNADEQLAPASMTKMMSLLLFMEAVEKGSMSLDEKIKISERASSMGGSQIFLEVGEEMTVEDLLKGIAIGSANDATVALAERIAGTEEAFVAKMNQKAKELGLKNTNFVNSSGLDAENHYSSARDMALIGKELVRHEIILAFSSIYEAYLREETDNKFWLVNTNKLVRFYPGVDGLKTGYTSKAGYCLTATLKQNNLRVIAVTMGESNSTTRNAEVTEMLNYAFNIYEGKIIFQAGDVVMIKPLEKAVDDKSEIVTTRDISIAIKKGEDSTNITYETRVDDLQAPVKAGSVIGKIDIIKDGKIVLTEYLTVKENIKKANIFQLFRKNLKDLFIGNVKL